MLSPDQVIPFLLHDDPNVRDHALRYFRLAHDPSPATCDDAWRVIDRFGAWRGELSPPLAALSSLPQTEYSYGRVMEALRATKAGSPERLYLAAALRWLDFELLLHHREELLSCEQLDGRLREHLRERLSLASEPAAAMWDRLIALAAEAESREDRRPDHQRAERLIEAIARDPSSASEAAGKALALLHDDSVRDWREIFAIELVGKVRHEPAVPTLVGRYAEDTDLSRERVSDALVRIGTVGVIEAVEAFYPGKEWHARLYAHNPLGRIKRPESEAALLRLLPREQAPDLLTNLAADLCDLCTTEGLEDVRRIIADGRSEPAIADLRELLLAVGTMVGYEPPEAPRWRAKLAADEARRQRWLKLPIEERLARGLARLQSGASAFRAWEDIDKPVDRKRLTRAVTAAVAGEAAPPVRRPVAKAGRNDPCPCGSGKKYKKCCWDKDHA